jgi:hypothetical protein
MKSLAASLTVAAVLAGGLTACASQPAARRSNILARDLTVILPPGSPRVSARRVSATTRSQLLHPLAAAEHLRASGPLAGRAVLTFHVGHISSTPFLAWLDGRNWIPVQSRYDARTGTVSASVTHFSTWAPFTWATEQLQKWMNSAIRGVLGLGNAPSLDCGAANGAAVADSNPGHDTIRACATAAGASTITKIANLRSYPVDLFYPPAAGGQCGGLGRCVQVAPADDPWLTLGAALSAASDKVLVPGSGTASVALVIPPGQSATMRTAVDTPAMYMAFLQAGTSVFTTIIGEEIKAIKVASDAVDALTASQCAAEGLQQPGGPLNAATAGSLARAAFGCLYSVLPAILNKLGKQTPALILGAFEAATGLASAAASSVWGLYDQYFGTHLLTVTVTVPPQACPSAAAVRQVLLTQPFWRATTFTVSPNVTCVGPYVEANASNTAGSGARVLLQQEATGLKYLVAGSGPICTVIPADVLPGQIVYIPPQYGHALLCLKGNGLA